jgi:hemin uptake protein HemP
MVLEKDLASMDMHGEAQSSPRIIPAEQLFGADLEVAIDHGGTVYRLRITRQGKLILTK